MIETLTFWIIILEDFDVGKLIGKPDGVMKDEVNIKNINSRKTMSVIEDILKAASILFFELRFIFWVLEAVQ